MKPSDLNPERVAGVVRSRAEQPDTSEQESEPEPVDLEALISPINNLASSVVRSVRTVRKESLGVRGIQGEPAANTSGMVELERCVSEDGPYSIVAMVTLVRGLSPWRIGKRGRSPGPIVGVRTRMGVMLEQPPPGFNAATNTNANIELAHRMNGRPVYVEWLAFEGTDEEHVRDLGRRDRDRVAPESWRGRALATLESIPETLQLIRKAARNRDLNPLT